MVLVLSNFCEPEWWPTASERHNAIRLLMDAEIFAIHQGSYWWVLSSYFLIWVKRLLVWAGGLVLLPNPDAPDPENWPNPPPPLWFAPNPWPKPPPPLAPAKPIHIAQKGSEIGFTFQNANDWRLMVSQWLIDTHQGLRSFWCWLNI